MQVLHYKSINVARKADAIHNFGSHTHPVSNADITESCLPLLPFLDHCLCRSRHNPMHYFHPLSNLDGSWLDLILFVNNLQEELNIYTYEWGRCLHNVRIEEKEIRKLQFVIKHGTMAVEVVLNIYNRLHIPNSKSLIFRSSLTAVVMVTCP